MMKFKTLSVLTGILGISVALSGCASSYHRSTKTSASKYAVVPAMGFKHESPIISSENEPGLGYVISAGPGRSTPFCFRKYRAQTLLVNNQLLLTLPTDYLFRLNRDEFKSSAYPLMRCVVNFLNQYPSKNIHISGNTDPIARNLKANNGIALSLSRANKVAGFLWANGIRQGNTHRKLTYSDNGDKYPIATNRKMAGMTKNRRIQIIVYPVSTR